MTAIPAATGDTCPGSGVLSAAAAARTTTESLILRAGASIGSEALALIPAGSTVILAGQGWLWESTSVYWEGMFGWVLTACLA